VSDINNLSGRSGRARTCDPRFWRPVLYQLSYTPTGLKRLAFSRQRAERFRYSYYRFTTEPYPRSSGFFMAARRAPSTAIAASSCMLGIKWL
jgi:hypothetical protein